MKLESKLIRCFFIPFFSIDLVLFAGQGMRVMTVRFNCRDRDTTLIHGGYLLCQMFDDDSEGMKNASSYCNAPKQLITSIADFESLGETRLPQGFNGEQKNDRDSEASSDINSLDDDEPEFFEPEGNISRREFHLI